MEWSRDSSVDIALGYDLEDRDSIPDRRRDFCLFYSLQTGSGAHPVFCPVGAGNFFSRDKAANA
jgi:hypothetical protein